MNLVAIASVESYLEGLIIICGNNNPEHKMLDREFGTPDSGAKPYYAPVSDEVEEGGECAGGVVAHVLKLGDELLAQFVVDD